MSSSNRFLPRHGGGESPGPHRIVAVAYDDIGLFELGIVTEVFGALRRPEINPEVFELSIAQAEPGPLRCADGLRLICDGDLRLLRKADLVVIPGWRDGGEAPPKTLLKALRQAHAQGARLMSICSGAYVLAATGLLDGRSATTHWRYAEDFRARFPAVKLNSEVLYVDEGDVITSAGSAAGIDACLHMVRQFCGADVANTIARTMVTQPHRDGGQAQFIPSPMPAENRRSLSGALDALRKDIGAPITVAQMATRANMSERSFLRHFKEEVGTTPKRWLGRERVGYAQRLLEKRPDSLEQIAGLSGFQSAEAFRLAFRLQVGVSPSTYRRRFQAQST
jgi:AraC family transcriptional activator FtrA